MRVVAFEHAHVEAAAALLAATARASATASGVRITISDLTVAHEVVARLVDAGPAVVALEGTSLRGFFIAPLPNTPGASSSRMTVTHHAGEPSSARTTYRQMYEVIAGELVAVGCFTHSILLPLDQEVAVTALFELGFGLDQIKGVCHLTTPASPTKFANEIRAGTDDDLDQLIDLAIELQRYHSRSPVLAPALLDVPGVRHDLQQAMDAERSTVLVARDGNRLVGMIQAGPDHLFVDTVTIGMNVVTESARARGVGTALLDRVCRWAADTGYEHCAVGWSAANLVSDAFYRAKGFAPVRYEMARNINARVAWANETLDYGRFELR